LDAGCGQGLSFRPLIEHLEPQRLLGVDFEEKCLARARVHAAAETVPIDVRQGDLAALNLPDETVDVIFCHQTLHHLVRQDAVLREFYRVLKPGGWLLLAESTRAYIQSWIIRWLFRHPMDVQRSAEEYLSMLRAVGFEFGPENVSFPYLWWSRADLGALEWFGFPMPSQRDETLVNVVATKPSGVKTTPVN
jgi:ubiquinone/menaquinone biosynthesis C-methylase UbiE